MKFPGSNPSSPPWKTLNRGYDAPRRFKMTRDWNPEDEYIGGSEEAGRVSGSGGDNLEQNYRNPNEMEMNPSFDDFQEVDPHHKRSRTTHPPQHNLIEILKGNGDLIPKAVKIWVERYEDSPRRVAAELLSMLFEACGAKYSITEEMLDETDVDDVVIALVNLARADETCVEDEVVLYLQKHEEMLQHNRKDIKVSIMKNYPQLLRKFMADKTKVPSLVEIIMFMKLELYSLKRQEQNFKAAVRLIKDAYFKHWEKEALRSCVKAITFCTSESKGVTLKDELLDKLTTAIKEVKDGNEEYSLLVNLKMLYELQLSQPVLAECIYDEIHNGRNLDQEVICFLLWSLHSVIYSEAMSQDSLSSLVSKRNQLAFRVCAVLTERLCLFRNSSFASSKPEILGYCPNNVLLRKLDEQIINTSDETEEEDENKECMHGPSITELLAAFNKPETCWEMSKLTSLSLFSKQERVLAGVRPPLSSLGQFKSIVHRDQNASISLGDVKKHLGSTVLKEFKKEKPRQGVIHCYNPRNSGNFQLAWISTKRGGPLPRNLGPKWGVNIVGWVRHQGDHRLCWAHVGVDLVSSTRVIEGLDEKYRLYSVPELCYFASPEDRLLQKGNHKCHSYTTIEALEYIQENGIGLHKGKNELNCATDEPSLEGERVKIKGVFSMADRLDLALQRLAFQPVGATVAVFQPEYDETVEGIYRGPTSHDSRFTEFHGLLVVDASIEDGEVILLCKSSHGTDAHNEGNIRVSASVMLLNVHFKQGHATCGLKEHLHFEEATPLIRGFVCPKFDTSGFVRHRAHAT